MRNILGIYSAPRPHWVGDGFPVRSMLSHFEQGEHVSPFILLDYAGPVDFEPTAARRGVGYSFLFMRADGDQLRQITRLLSKRLRKLETGVDLQVAKLRL